MTKDHMKNSGKGMQDRRGGPAGPKSGEWHKTGLVGEEELTSFAPLDVETTNYVEMHMRLD